MQSSKFKSAGKKIATIAKVGLDPFFEGKHNFENQKIEIETLAESRALTCIECENYLPEPIDECKVIDIRIPELSEMFCDACGCELPYKLRQSINKCALWEK